MPKQVPVIDFAPFLDGDADGRRQVAAQIFQACHEVGFMYLKRHGIEQARIEAVFDEARGFFALPEATKERLAWPDEHSNRGYVGLLRERLDPNQPGDLKEAFNAGLEQEGQPENRWPESREGFRRTLIQFFSLCCAKVDDILRAFAVALLLPEEFFVERHAQRSNMLRLLHYPPVAVTPEPGQTRAGEHSDYGSITLLFQDEVGGLEVRTAQGEWIAASAIPETMLVNTGDLMQRWTNHVFCSTRHRVGIPTGTRAGRSRYSVAFFGFPNHDARIECLDTCITAERQRRYPPIRAYDYLLERLRATY